MTNMIHNTDIVREDDEISNLTNIENPDNLNLSEFCVSSDADTEKLGSDVINADEDLHPHLSRLINDRSELGGVKLENGGTHDVEINPFNNSNDDTSITTVTTNNNDVITDNVHDNITVPIISNSVVAFEMKEETNDEVSTPPPLPLTTVNLPLTTSREQNPTVDTSAELAATTKSDSILQDEIDEEDDDEVKDGNELEENEETKGDNEMDDEDAEEDAEEEDEDDEEEEDEDDDETKEKMLSPMELEQKRQDAINDIVNIEYQFAELRQRLYENKLVKLEMELKMCLDGSHTELHQYYTKIAEIRDNKLKKAYQRQKYELNCIHKETFATRTMIHQNFYKKVNHLKRRLLSNTTREWYDINKERRDMDTTVPDIHYHVPIKLPNKTLSCITGYAGPAQRLLPGEPISEDLQCENIQYQYKYNPVDKLEVIVDRMRLNNQISDMMGLIKYFNAFPGAPQLNPLRDSEINNDLEFIQRHKW